MANLNAPSGFVPARHFNSGDVRNSVYQIASALASNIYRGSAVIPVGTNKRIDVATAGARVSGVFQGVSYVLSNGDTQFRPYWASGTALKTGSIAEATVWDDPMILFSAQVSGAAGVVQADIGALADILVGTGSTVTGQSGDMVDQSTLTPVIATGGQLQVYELSKIVGNDVGQYGKVLVRWNEHFGFGSTTAGQALTTY